MRRPVRLQIKAKKYAVHLSEESTGILHRAGHLGRWPLQNRCSWLTPQARLRRRPLNSLVLSFSTTVRAIRESFRMAVNSSKDLVLVQVEFQSLVSRFRKFSSQGTLGKRRSSN